MRSSGWWRGLGDSLGAFADALLPCGCPVCRAAVSAGDPPLCPVCEARVSEIPRPLCPRCGLTRVIAGVAATDCAECHSWPAVLPAASSACLHAGVAAELVRGLKYRGWTRLADFMGDRMVAPARRLTGPSSPVLVPVPLAAPRHRERGFNQAALLAGAISRSTGWPVRGLLSRSRPGPPLARLGRAQRKVAIEGAYSVTAAIGDSRDGVAGVLLVDDVITTGATGLECAETLARGGVHCLGIVSFARTDPLAEPV